MGKLIDDFLNLARVTRTEITSLAQSIPSDLRASAPQRRVDITIQPGLEARADPSLLHLSLANLFENAWKFTSKRPGARRIRTRRWQQPFHLLHSRQWRGVRSRPRRQSFWYFRRLHAATEFPGTGIGLATVQPAVQRHGGIIWAESQPNRGATFYFTLTRGKS